MSVTYSHVIDICENGENLGNIKFNVTFEISNTFTLEANTNLTEYLSDKSTPMMFMRCRVTSVSCASLDVTASITMNYSEPQEAVYVVCLSTQKIHLPTCIHCPKILPKNYALMNLTTLAEYNADYEMFECKVCQPFTLDGSTFYINRESWIVHVKSCFHLKGMNPDDYLAYSMYPVGQGIRDCKDCQPEKYTETLAEHVGKSLENKDFEDAFKSVKNATKELLKAGGASPIDEDTKPKILIPLACFEVPIYLEPKFDFDLKANFKFHSDVTVVNSAMMALIYRDGELSVIGDFDNGEPTSTATIDVTGELDIELGVITEIRFGLRYLSKHVYVGLMMDMGVYLDAGGVFSYDFVEDSGYFAASLELGAYAEARCTYAIIGLVSADSFYILDKTRLPVFNSGDVRVYFRYENTEDSMNIINVKKLWLDNTYLMCNYYDLKEMDTFKGSLSWKGSAQYEIQAVFRDESGNEVDYVILRNGAIEILDGAPDSFTVYMTVTVVDKVQHKTFAEYFGTANKNGYAIFLPEKVIKISYSYTDTTEQMNNALDVYKGTYTFESNGLLGPVTYYRNLLLGVHSSAELMNDDAMLRVYAIYASYSQRDQNGNPVKVYTADDIRAFLSELACEYVMVLYASPGDHPFDEMYEFKLVQAYWNDGLYSNSSNQFEISGDDTGSSVYLDLGTPDATGMFGGVYADASLAEKIGDFELLRTSL